MSKSKSYQKAINILTISGIIIVSVLFVFGECLAQGSQTAVQFLLIPPDARGRSLGDGGSVYSSGAISAFYNPANLVNTGIISGEINYSKLLPHLTDNLFFLNAYGSLSLPDWGYWGAHFTWLDYQDQDRRDEFANSLGTFHSYDFCAGLSWAFSIDPNNSIGASAKFINSHLAQVGAGSEKGVESARSFALDIGFSSKNYFPGATISRIEVISFPALRESFRKRSNQGFAFGVSVANLGPDITYFDADQSDPLPRRLRIATGYQAIDIDLIGLRLTLDGSKILVDMNDGFDREWQEIVWSYGLEATLLYLVDLRFGRQLDRIGRQRINTVGIGIGPEWFRLDYYRALSGDENWNRRGDEYSISIFGNY